MAFVAQLVFVLFHLVSITESSDMFGLVGDSVQLLIQRHVPEFDEFIWEFENVKNVLKYYNDSKKIKPSSAYGGRVEFNVETYTLTLKNLQKTDSGLYEAKASNEDIRVVAKYKLSVLDPVEDPVLTHQLSRDTCNITLTCRGHNISVISSCYNETCEEKEDTSPGHNLSLSVNGSSISCNHSNPVSWKTDVLEMRKLKQLCIVEGLNIPKPNSAPIFQGIIIAVIVLTIISAAVFLSCRQLHRRRRSEGHIECENTVYAEVEKNGAETAHILLETPSTVYSVVQKPTTNGQSSQTPVPENEQQLISLDHGVPNTYESFPDQTQDKKPETIYAAVSKPNKAVNEAK
ncbi:hypothetical protein AOLI_G00213840 [Acnodon oligacanthus]